jgi:hypothetical protein
MFNFVKKIKHRHRINSFVAAVRKTMPPALSKEEKESLIQSLKAMSPDALKHKLLKKYCSIEEAENENMVTDSRLGDSPVPFGFNNNEWRELLTKMQDGDELWTFSTSDESWDNLAGRAGVSLVRDGKTVYSIVTEMN